VIKVNMKNKAQVLGLDRITDWMVISDGVSVGEVMYQAGKWDKPRRIIVLHVKFFIRIKKIYLNILAINIIVMLPI
jgi:hypothetical protein